MAAERHEVQTSASRRTTIWRSTRRHQLYEHVKGKLARWKNWTPGKFEKIINRLPFGMKVKWRDAVDRIVEKEERVVEKEERCESCDHHGCNGVRES